MQLPALCSAQVVVIVAEVPVVISQSVAQFTGNLCVTELKYSSLSWTPKISSCHATT